jgi:hypothetical protein
MIAPELETDVLRDDEPLPDLDDSFEPIVDGPLFGRLKAAKAGVKAVGSAAGGAAKAVASAAVDV